MVAPWDESADGDWDEHWVAPMVGKSAAVKVGEMAETVAASLVVRMAAMWAVKSGLLALVLAFERVTWAHELVGTSEKESESRLVTLWAQH